MKNVYNLLKRSSKKLLFMMILLVLAGYASAQSTTENCLFEVSNPSGWIKSATPTTIMYPVQIRNTGNVPTTYSMKALWLMEYNEETDTTGITDTDFNLFNPIPPQPFIGGEDYTVSGKKSYLIIDLRKGPVITSDTITVIPELAPGETFTFYLFLTSFTGTTPNMYNYTYLKFTPSVCADNPDFTRTKVVYTWICGGQCPDEELLTVFKSDENNDPVDAKGTLRYYIYINNTSGSPFSNIWVNEVFPKFTSYISNTAPATYEPTSDGCRWLFSSIPNGLTSFELKLDMDLEAIKGYNGFPVGTNPGQIWNDTVQIHNTVKLSLGTTPTTYFSPFTETTTIYRNLWVGGTDTNWENDDTLWDDTKSPFDQPINWTVGVPPTGKNVVFARLNQSVYDNYYRNVQSDLIHDAISDRTIGDLVNQSGINYGNNPGKALIVAVNSALTVNGTATTDAEERLIIKSKVDEANGSMVFDNPGTNGSVKATVEYDSKSQKTTGTWPREWQYIGSPVQEAIPTDVFGEDVSGSRWGPVGSVLIRKHNEAKLNDPNEIGDKWDDVDVSVAMTPFAGYEVVQPTLNTDTTIYRFKGILNVGDFNTGNLGFTSGAYYRGNYILANSYVAPIDISKLDTVGEDNNFISLEKTIYLYNTGSRDQWLASEYGTINGTTGNPGTYFAVPVKTATTLGVDQIPSLNGFMVRSLKDLGTTDTRQFNFKYASLKSGSGTGITANKPMYVKAASASEKQKNTYPLLMIDVKGTSGVDRVHLITAPNTTKGFDNGWDGVKYRTQTDAQIYTLAGGTDRYQVSTDSDLDGTILGFYNGTNETEFTLTFRLKDMENVYNLLQLEDLATGAKTSITDGGTFRFNVTSASPEARFRINGTIAQIPPVGTESPITITYDKSNKLTVNNGSTEAGTLRVFNVTGTMVYETAMPVGLSNIKLNLKKGVYILEGSTESYQTTAKVIMH